MIIATAGHVDHGKTSLVRQLTGVETDTLAEDGAEPGPREILHYLVRVENDCPGGAGKG